MKLKDIPQQYIVTGIAIMVLVVILIASLHDRKGSVPPPSSAQQTDSSLGLYTDIIANKNSTQHVAPASHGKTGTAVTAPSACTLSLQIAPTSNTASTKNYTVTVRNNGKTSCTSASLSLYYDANESYDSASPAPTSSGYYWNFGTLSYGATKTINLTTDIASGDVAPLEGCLSADNGSDSCITAGAKVVTPTTAVASVTVPHIVSDGKKIPVQSGQEAGVWEWNDIQGISKEDMQTIINQASSNGFTAIYLTIDKYLDLQYETDAAKRASDVASYTDTLESFVSMAKNAGIAVDAEAGWRDWGSQNQRQKAIDVLSYVQQFNASQPAKIRGMQYDIESYLLPQYDEDKAAVLTQYVGLVDILEKQAGSAGIPLTMVIPHFYDAAQQWTPSVSYNGSDQYTFNQLLTLLGRHKGNRMIVMAYRNTTDGNDGTIALAQKEIDDATAAGNGVKIIVAQETGNVDPAYVTFAHTSRSMLFSQLATINATFASKSAYGGIAIDYLDPFLQLQ